MRLAIRDTGKRSNAKIDLVKLYFARHGQTNRNASNGKAAAVYDEPLNQNGVEQAKELAEELKNIKLNAIISSPLKRAYKTAEVINKHHDLTVKVDDAWVERKADSYFLTRIYKAVDTIKNEYAGKSVLVVSHGGPQHALYAYANKLPLSGNMRISPMRNGEGRVYEL